MQLPFCAQAAHPRWQARRWRSRPSPKNPQRAPQRRLAAGPEASPSVDINADRDRAIDLEVRVEPPPLHHAAAGLAIEERRSRRECSRTKSGKSFLKYLTPVILGSQIFLRRLPAVAVSLPAG